VKEYGWFLQMGILGKLAKGTAKVVGRRVREDIVFKAMPKILSLKETPLIKEKEEEIIVLKTGGRRAMKTFKLVLRAEDGSSVWINVNYIVKMTKTREGNYYIYLLNGEKYLIDHRTASAVESCFEG
jgi:hypothetical protein